MSSEAPCFGGAWWSQAQKFEWFASPGKADDGLLASTRSLGAASVSYELVLMEIVGALGLDSKKKSHVDPYCVVEVFDLKKQAMVSVHRTDIVWNNANPVWTAKTKSLCLLNIPHLEESRSRDLFEFVDTVQNNTEGATPVDSETRRSVVIRLFDSSFSCLGVAVAPFSEILDKSQTEERMEISIIPSAGCALRSKAAIFLRFRLATLNDISFLNKLNAGHRTVRDLAKNEIRNDTRKLAYRSCDTAIDVPVVSNRMVAADINFQSVKARPYFRRRQKIDSQGQKLSLVRPYPNPTLPSREWMTQEQIDDTALAESSQWVKAGCGSAGTLYLEVLRCDSLPIMDIDSSDPFAVIAFEDSFLRTDVIWEQTSPRWPCWCTRAFQLGIHHPSSLVFVAVADFDESPLDDHDPIGRVVLHLGSFRPGLTYTLHYPLQYDPNQKPPSLLDQARQGCVAHARGMITLRLRVEWQNEPKAMKLFLAPPPRFIINVDNVKSFDILGYTIRGAAYMEKPSVSSVSILANEITSYSNSLCFTLDVWLEIFLWRGRLEITDTWSIWFPLRSILFFCWAITLVERPDLFIPIQLVGTSWILLSINYHASRHNSPWESVPSSLEMGCRMWLGFLPKLPFLKSPWLFEACRHQGFDEAVRYEKLDKLKADRISTLFSELMSLSSKISKVCGGESVQLTTERINWSFLSGQLSSVHMILTLIVSYLRVVRSFLRWRNVYTAVVTSNCLILAGVWLMLPVGWLFHWSVRIMVLFVHGPWLKIIDMWYFRPWYETKDELLRRIDEGREEDDFVWPDFDAVLENNSFQQAASLARANTEDLTKLRDMRSLLFGNYSERIPYVDTSRYSSIPLPQSTAVEDKNWTPHDSGRSYYVPGQLLTGKMIHKRPCASFS